MSRSILSFSSAAVAALVVSFGCSSRGVGNGSASEPPPAPVVLAVSPAPVATTPTAVSAVPATAPNRAATPPASAAPEATLGTRSSPVQVLEQMLTTQALLVSLLLTPLSKDGAGEPVARVDVPSGGLSGNLP